MSLSLQLLEAAPIVADVEVEDQSTKTTGEGFWLEKLRNPEAQKKARTETQRSREVGHSEKQRSKEVGRILP